MALLRWLLRLLLLCCAVHGQDMRAVFNLHGESFDKVTSVGRWVVLFFYPACQQFQQLVEPLASLSVSHDLIPLLHLRLGMLDCTRYAATCAQVGVRSSPFFLWRNAPDTDWHELPSVKGPLGGLRLYLQKLLRPELHIQQISRREQLLTFGAGDAAGARVLLMLPTVPPNRPIADASADPDLATAGDVFLECYRRGAGFPLLAFAVCRSSDILVQFTGQGRNPRLVLFKEDVFVPYHGPMEADAASAWVAANRIPTVLSLNDMLHWALRDANRSLAILALDSRKERAVGRAAAFGRSLSLAANDTALQQRFLFARADLADKALKRWLRPALDPPADKAAGRPTLPTFLVYNPHQSWVWRNDVLVDQMRLFGWRDEPCEHILRRFLYRILDGEEPPHLLGLWGVLHFIAHLVHQAPRWLLILGGVVTLLVALILPLALVLNCVLDVLECRARQRMAHRATPPWGVPGSDEKVVLVKRKEKAKEA